MEESTPFLIASISLRDRKRSKNKPGATANTRVIAPTIPKEMNNCFPYFWNPSSEQSSFKPSNASKGIVNSATTKADETARNFEYIGI